MKKTLLVLALVLVTLTTLTALSPKQNVPGTDTSSHIYYVTHHYFYRGYGPVYYAPRVYVAPVVPVWYTRYYYFW
ncbi:MAG TPA: hypothetical protein VK419_03955 [Bryobacteraceae bacterium]|nr:hypothetical protein [Bryobacteraceae bacterium]